MTLDNGAHDLPRSGAAGFCAGAGGSGQVRRAPVRKKSQTEGPGAQWTEIAQVIEVIGDGVALYDADDRLALCNEAYRGFYRLVADQLVPGVRFEDLLLAKFERGQFAESAEPAQDRVRRWLERHRDMLGHEARLSDGRWLRITERKIGDGWTVAVHTDISPHNRAEEQLWGAQQQFRSIAESAVDAIVSADAAGRIIFWNSGARAIFGYEADEVLGQSLTILMPERYREAHESGLARFRAGGTARVIGNVVEVHGLRKGGGEFPLELSLSTWRQGGETFFGGILRDSSERKRREAELLALSDELRAQTLKLERSNRELEDFASVASHDLQEPLRKVEAFGDRLKAKCAEGVGEEGKLYIDRMQCAAGRMRALINDLLTYSRVTTKAQPFVPVDLDELVRGILSDLQISIEQAEARVEVTALPPIEADPTQLRQLLQNLLSNALKFRRPGVVPTIKLAGQLLPGEPEVISGVSPTGEVCEITVADNGIGFEAQYAERIFGIFERLHARNEYEGTGIGLATCRKIAERHGGSIAAESEPGRGATFIVRLPTRHSSAKAAAA